LFYSAFLKLQPLARHLTRDWAAPLGDPPWTDSKKARGKPGHDAGHQALANFGRHNQFLILDFLCQ
jgi:hypothetical protein